MAWMNKDNLYIKFGGDQGKSTVGGNFATPANGGQTVLEVVIEDLSKLGSSAAPTILSDVINLPKNARLEKVVTECLTAADSSGDGATLNIGSIRRDRSTEIDFDGFIAAQAQTTIDAEGETTETVVGGTAAGVLMGKNISATYPGYLVAHYGTEAFTQGRVKVRIYLTQIS